MNFSPFITWDDSIKFSESFDLKEERSILENFVNEIFYRVMDFLDIRSLQNLSLTSKTIFNRIYLSGHEKALLIFGRHYLKTICQLLLNKAEYLERFCYITRVYKVFTSVNYEEFLYKSVITGNISVFKYFFEGVKFNKQTMTNVYFFAISRKQNRIVSFLQDEGFNYSKQAKVLKYACKNGNIEILKELLNKATNLGFENKKSLFCKAALHGQLETIQLLIEKFKYKGFFTLLPSAVRGNQLDVVNFYLEKDKELGFVSSELNNGRFWSIKLGRLELLKLIDLHIKAKKKAYLTSHFQKFKKSYKSANDMIVHSFDYLFKIMLKLLSVNHPIRASTISKAIFYMRQSMPENVQLELQEFVKNKYLEALDISKIGINSLLFSKKFFFLAFLEGSNFEMLDIFVEQWNEKFHSKYFTHLSEAFQNMYISILKYMIEPEAIVDILSEHKKGKVYLTIRKLFLSEKDSDWDTLLEFQDNALLILLLIRLKNFELLEKLVLKDLFNEKELKYILESDFEMIKWYLDYKSCLKYMSFRYFLNIGINISKLALDSFVLVFNHFSWSPDDLLNEYISELVNQQNLLVLSFLVEKLKRNKKSMIPCKEVNYYIYKEIRNGNLEIANVLVKLKKNCKTD